MKLFRTIFFSLNFFLFLISYIIKIAHIPVPIFVSSYLADLVCMPIILTISLVTIRVVKKNEAIYLTFSMIVGMTVFYSVVFEQILPVYSSKYVRDYWDILAYFIGALTFLIIQRKWKRKRVS